MNWFGVVAAAIALLLSSGHARAREASGSGGIAVTAEGCDDLRAPEIERVLHIELAAVSDQWTGPEPMRVELTCEGAQVRVVAIDPVTDKRLSRDVQLRRVRDRDRTVALLVSQLFLTSWSELLLRPDPETPLPAPARPAPTRAPILQAAEGLARKAIAPPSWSWYVAIVGGPRVRDFASPVISGRAAMRPSVLLDRHWSLALELGYERGAATRASGSVGYSLASAALGAGFSTTPMGPLAFDFGARAGAAYVDLHGDAALGNVVGTSASGTAFELALGLGPTLLFGPTRVGLELAGGATAPRVVAHVARDTDVALGGLWAGANLVVGVAEAQR